MRPELSPFEIEESRRDGRHVLAPRGELDTATALELEVGVTRACGDGAEEIEIDLRGLTFIDSHGLRAILRAKELCAENHARLSIVPSPIPMHRRLFEITGLHDALPWRHAGIRRPDPQV